jgi:hypothetical protein
MIITMPSDPTSEIVSAVLTQLSLTHHPKPKPILKLRPQCGRNQTGFTRYLGIESFHEIRIEVLTESIHSLPHGKAIILTNERRMIRQDDIILRNTRFD